MVKFSQMVRLFEEPHGSFLEPPGSDAVEDQHARNCVSHSGFAPLVLSAVEGPRRFSRIFLRQELFDFLQ